MIRLPMEVHVKLASAHLMDYLPLIQDECAARGYLLHLTAILGSGGFGTVFLAEKAGRTVALKVSVPRPDMEALFAAMCAEEGRKSCLLGKIPQVAAGEAYWFSHRAPLFFLVSRYIHGVNLNLYQRRTGGPLDEDRLLRWALDLTEGLAAMHQMGVVHRDLKPENVLLEEATDRVYITDLGIAKYAREGTLEELRSTGTHPYAPLEQILGHSSPKSDQYALGIVLFELATGTHALPPVPAPKFRYPVARPARLAPRQHNAALSSGFAAIIERLAALKPADRFPSMQAAHVQLRTLQAANQRGTKLHPMEAVRQAGTRGACAAPPPTAAARQMDAAAARPARLAFAWRPHQHLIHLFIGRPITQRGPHQGLGEIAGLMVLYYAWLVATGLCAGFTWWAISGEQN